MPAGQQVLGVEGSDLRDWTLAPAAPDGRQRIVVNLATPAREHYKLRVTLEAPVATLPAKLPVPTLEIARAEGQSGTITVAADPALAVTVDAARGRDPAGCRRRETGTDNPRAVPARSWARTVSCVCPTPSISTSRAAEPVVEVHTGTLYTVDTDTLEMDARR